MIIASKGIHNISCGVDGRMVRFIENLICNHGNTMEKSVLSLVRDDSQTFRTVYLRTEQEIKAIR